MSRLPVTLDPPLYDTSEPPTLEGEDWRFTARPERLACEDCGATPLCGLLHKSETRFRCAFCDQVAATLAVENCSERWRERTLERIAANRARCGA